LFSVNLLESRHTGYDIKLRATKTQKCKEGKSTGANTNYFLDKSRQLSLISQQQTYIIPEFTLSAPVPNSAECFIVCALGNRKKLAVNFGMTTTFDVLSNRHEVRTKKRYKLQRMISGDKECNRTKQKMLRKISLKVN